MNLLQSKSDAQLVSEYIKGNESCLAVLIERHQQKIFGFILSKTGDRDLANDLFQDTFIKIIHTLKRGAYNEEGKFLPWAIRISHNLTMDFYRDKKRKKTKYATDTYDVLDFIGIEDVPVESKIEQEETLRKIISLIATLPEDQQQVLKMRIFMGMSFKEIADQTEVSINTSLGRMRYALINLRKVIEEKEIFIS
ncbi:RNA polymerase sigma-70 factor (ECF subfamily) [Wenyingzhuangia heitensis]|uniref:RNA polymerase sigma-70 factor (ECF subfamily) n=1 Tax=Wenyingzhuangia heitensis TaxID=1487859 RepID=A0ABX0U9Y4_9FLAO|nr:sigma-70 family RNA polymerase sigma factor [Wenyingzhuangia heitensis]NIJ45627.1 RNA polymerase sigma-70 factor (ECF subfamily) [Wenyingzhuangia heitensis]